VERSSRWKSHNIYIVFTFTEVFRAKCEGDTKPLSEEEDKKIEMFLRQAWVRPIIVDEVIAIAARRLMRRHPQCKKPSDGIHLATALRLSVDEMHTFDGSDLLGLTGKINRTDGKPLVICKPTPAPAPLRSDGPLFELGGTDAGPKNEDH